MEKFKLGFDVVSKRVVHIDLVTPGFDTAICPDCKSALIASNLNVVSRKRDTYFRHRSTASCSQMTLMHLWAQQIVRESPNFLIPSIKLEASERDADKKVHSFSEIMDAKFVSIEKSKLEKRIGEHNEFIVADVYLTDNSGSEFVVEVFVTHKSSPEKIQYLKENNIEAIEIELLPAPDGILDHPDRFKSYVLENANRYWLHCARYQSEITNLQELARRSVHEKSIKILELRRERERNRVSRRNRKSSWRDSHATLIFLLNAYGKFENRTRALSKFDLDFFEKDGIFHPIYREIFKRFSRIPKVCSVSLAGELSFKCHRSVWQFEVYKESVIAGISKLNEFKANPPKGYYADFGYSDLYSFDPAIIYTKIKDRVPVTKIVLESELINGAPLNSESRINKNDKFEGLTTKEWEMLPKPICAIRRYLNYLVGEGLLIKLSADAYSYKGYS